MTKIATALVYTILATYLLLKPKDSVPEWQWLGWAGVDKVVHLAIYALMTALWKLANVLNMRLLTILLIMHGALMELGQYILPIGREATLADLLADAFGVLLALLANNIFESRMKK